MADWLSSMSQTFEYYEVDPETWKDVRLLDNVISSSISRDSDAETLGSASINVTESVGESYIRIYLVTVQNGVTEKHPLGTFLVQTPSSSFDGKIRTVTVDAYTPLLELKENQPPIGYSISKGENIMSIVHRLTSELVRAPVIEAESDAVLNSNFVANVDDTWSLFLSDLLLYAKYSYSLDEMGRILFSPKQDTASLQPVWTYTDDNSSILYPDISMDHDLFGIPNVVEVVYSKNSENGIAVPCRYAVAINDDPNSPTSTVRRGRRITYRDTDPSFAGEPTAEQLQEYAEKLLKDMSTIEYTVTYSHGYCPVRLGDCVRLNYARAGIPDVKARVISQTIDCTPGCKVTEKAVFTTKLWR